MDAIKDGSSFNRPPILYGTHYDYWKARMVAFLKSIDNKTWKVVVKGLKHPEVTSQDGSTSLKPESDWSKDEDDEALGNDKALNTTLNGVDKNMFKIINTCTEAKEAWKTLKTAHEGTSNVRMSRLHLLTTEFENLKMMEDESISYSLGKHLFRKILISLPQKFDMNVKIIE